jgi:hypothetical protein
VYWEGKYISMTSRTRHQIEASGQHHGPDAPTPRKELPAHVAQEDEGPQSLSGRDVVEKNSQPLSVLELPIIQSVAQRHPIEPSRLLKQIKSGIRCHQKAEKIHKSFNAKR